MDIKQLKTFICVAESGSLSRASDRLRIAQPALSRQIKLLEHEIGVALFDRHVRGMDLTDAGKELLGRVSGPIYQLEQSMYDVRSMHSSISGHVTVGILPTMANMLAVRLIERATRELPGVTVRLKEAYSVNLIEWIQNGEIDVTFLYGPQGDYHLRTRELLYEDIVLLSPPDALAGHGAEIDIADVARLPLALPSRPFGPRIIVDALAKKAGISLTAKFEVDSFWIIIDMVKSGLCHSFMPLSSVTAEAAKGTLEVRRIRPGNAHRQLILGFPSDRTNTRATDAVTDLLIDEIAGMVRSGQWAANPGSDLREAM